MTILRTRAFLFLLLALAIGCGDLESTALRELKNLNSTNVMKVRTCLLMYAARNNYQLPDSKETLLTFLRGGAVDTNLERIGIAPDDIEGIFVSDRDGEELKVRWGVPYDPSAPAPPLVFEATGVGGVRLVAADRLLEVEDDARYEKLWNGEYEPATSEAY